MAWPSAPRLRCIGIEWPYLEAMATRTIPMSVRQQSLLRMASLCLALAVALLSSLMSGGLPRTTTVGSAFNPATTSVALQPSRAQPRMLADQLRRDDDPAGGQDAASFPTLAILHPAEPIAPPEGAPEAPVSSQPSAQLAGLDGNPRGPPLA
jgi:hypothetical protein